MSRKKQDAPAILGPDGKPLDLAAMQRARDEAKVAAADAEPIGVMTGLDVGKAGDLTYTFEYDTTAMTAPYQQAFLRYLGADLTAKPPAKKRTLRERVDSDLRALGVDPVHDGEAELPKPKRDLHTYAGALAQAIDLCLHEDAEDTMHAQGQFFCQSCHRYLTRAQLREARRKANGGGIFGHFFGGNW